MDKHPLVQFGWAPGDYIHARCVDCNPEGQLIHDLLTDGWLGDKLAWRCQPCAIKAKEKFEVMMDEHDREIERRDQAETPKPVTIQEFIQRGMDSQLKRIISKLVGVSITKNDFIMMMTEEEKNALGYGTVCPCGEKGMLATEKLCGCGEKCQKCCESECQDCKCRDACPCKDKE